MEKMLSEKAAGNLLGRSEATMKLNRRLGKGPVYYRIGRTIRYREADLNSYIQRCRVEPVANSGGSPGSSPVSRGKSSESDRSHGAQY